MLVYSKIKQIKIKKMNIEVKDDYLEKTHLLQVGARMMTNCMRSINVVFNDGIPSYSPKFEHDVSKITCEFCLNYISKKRKELGK